MWWPVRGWDTPPKREGKSPHLYPAPRKGGPNPPFYRYPASGPRPHAPGKQPRQPFLSQSAMRGSHVLACNGVRLTSQLKWRKAGQPARVMPYIDCAMLSHFLLIEETAEFVHITLPC